MTATADLFGELGDLAALPVEELEALACRADLGVFSQRVLGYQMAPFQDEWCEIAQTESRLCVVAPREHPLALDTSVIVPGGRKRMGDLHVGDQVIGGNGTPTEVTAVSSVYTDLRCYRITFDDGEQVVASAGHRWRTYRRGAHQEVTTEQIAADQSERYRHVIDCVRRESEDVPLPIDPWLLGYWLGNGSRSSAFLDCHTQDAEFIADRVRELGYPASITPRHHSQNGSRVNVPGGLLTALRQNDLFRNKHVPEAYLWAGTKQRLELLRGLLDSDGTCLKSGQVLFSQRLQCIAEAACDLIASLGWKPMRYTAATPYGPTYGVSFYPDEPVFSFERKAERQRPPGKRSKATGRAIVDVTETLTVPTRCITTVAGSFLIGEGIASLNSKTETFTVNATTHRSVYIPGFWTYIFSQTLDQAKDVLARIRDVVESVDSSLVRDAVRDSAEDLQFANGARITVAGAGKRVRGAHPDAILGDDVLDDEGTATAHQRRKTHRWWFGTVTNMAHPGTTRNVRTADGPIFVSMPPTVIHLVGTPFHANDLLLGMRENQRYAFYRYAAECPPDARVPGTWAVEVAR